MDILNFKLLTPSFNINICTVNTFPRAYPHMAKRAFSSEKGGNVAVVELQPSSAHPNLTAHHPLPPAINALLQPGRTSKCPTPPPTLLR